MLVCIYRQQEISCNVFCEELELFMEGNFEKADVMLLVGDFNVWVDVDDNADAKKLLTEMFAHGLSQLVEEPTHISGHTLDHVYVNLHQIDLHVNVLNDRLGISPDHYPVIVELPAISSKSNNDTRFFRKLKDMNMELFKNEFKEVCSGIDFSLNNNFTLCYNNYVQNAQKIFNKHAPLVAQKAKKQCSPPWADAEFKKCRAKRRKLEKQWRRTKTEESRNEYIEQRKVCAELSIVKQWAFYSNKVEESASNQHSLFKIVDDMLDRKSERSPKVGKQFQ